jgi:GNAT superfamily N-acetyltransferase
VTIRRARVDDSAVLARLVSELGYPVEPDVMRARLQELLGPEGGDYTVLAAESEAEAGTGRKAEIVGVLAAHLSRSLTQDGLHAVILALVVDDAHRGHRLGRELVAAAESWARAAGAGRILVNCALHREQAHHFYRGLGYAQTGLRFVRTLGPE